MREFGGFLSFPGVKKCYVSCVPDMEVTKVPQNRAQLELIAQGDKSKFPVVVEGGGAAAEEREIRFQALLLVRRLTLLQVGWYSTTHKKNRAKVLGGEEGRSSSTVAAPPAAHFHEYCVLANGAVK
ncbi:unnamed protein product [Sphagnum troendelagicum]|uniref:Uncharacterized protein n=1 Tax=Sphagnum troendelagicum TaxID=128251 RepID=A0ABP0U514_9BRYO